MTENDTALVTRDYQANRGQLFWDDGEMGEKTITINLLDDLLVEDTKRFTVTLADLKGSAILGNNAQAQVTIQDDDTTTLQFTQTTYMGAESGGQAIITVTRLGGINRVTVDYMTYDDTAMANEDYLATQGTLTWLGGDQRDKTITIPLIHDRTVEGNETFEIRLSNPSNQAILGDISTATVTITESEPNSCEVGTALACYVVQDDEDQPLKNIEILPAGTLQGGWLGGRIQNRGWIQDVSLLPYTRIVGGTVSGRIIGDIELPTITSMLSYVNVTASARLEYVVIDEGTTIDSRAFLGQGVRFMNNQLIPQNIDLSGILPKPERSILGQDSVILSEDVLFQSAIGGILGAINSLPHLERARLTLVQDPIYGQLHLDIGTTRYAVLPMQVRHILKKMVREQSLGMFAAPDGKIIFITHTGREVTTQPVVQAPEALRTALSRYGLNQVNMLNNGNLQIPTPDDIYFTARASLYATQVVSDMPLGLSVSEMGVYLIFDDEQGTRWQQFIYPAAANPETLAALVENGAQVLLTNEGQLTLDLPTGALYQGRLDYAVTTGQQRQSKLQVHDLGDVNGDNCPDHKIDYGNGESQILYCVQ
jgi:hypothetical protein